MLLGCAKCGRTVLDVFRPSDFHYGPLYTDGGLTVSPVNVRTGDFKMFRHMPAADSNPTYSWTCSNCGYKDSRRHERIVAVWPRFIRLDANLKKAPKPPRVLRFRIGTDL